MNESKAKNIEIFKEFCISNQDLAAIDDSYQKTRQRFLKEYPIERIKTLSEEEYCIGTAVSKQSFCYAIEFGKYKEIGFGIGGGSSQKFGIYYNKKESCYKRGSNTIDDIDHTWPLFRDELYQFLIDCGLNEPKPLEDYPMLQGMAMILTNLLCIYYPDKYVTIGAQGVLQPLMDYFGYPYEAGMRCHQLNYYFNQNIRNDVEELKEADGQIIGALAWNFEHEYIEKKTKKIEREAGLGDEDVSETRYWVYSPGENAYKWPEYSKNGVMGIGWGQLGNLSDYDTHSEMVEKMQEIFDSNRSFKNDSLATWQFVHDISLGDIIYAKKGQSKLVGRGIVTSDYYYDANVKDDYKNFRKVEWINIGEWEHPGKAVTKTLTDISAYTDYIQKLEDLFRDEEEDEIVTEKEKVSYSKTLFLNEVYMDEEDYNTLVGLIKSKKNVILQGAPGVGKTFAAYRLAYSILGEKDKERVQMVQFHQSYSYEDFIEGFRPSSDNNGFEIKKGSFYEFCKKAADDKENAYFFIIDEINRGNLSKIFGELFMLIEKDKRDNTLRLLYSGEKFAVPGNVYIIGMMNTADRSLAMMDYALRRRFAFYEMKPAFDQNGFIKYRMSLDSPKFNNLIECVKRINEAIKEDNSLGEGFCIGHSYFCDIKAVTDKVLNNIVEYELIPLLKEYWFDDPSKVRDWAERLRSSIK